MQALTAANQAITVDISAGSVQWVSSWIEFSGSTIEDPQANIRSNSGSMVAGFPVTIIPTPTPGNQSQIKFISIRSLHSLPINVTVLFDSSSPIAELIITLQPGDTLIYVDSRGWYVLDSSGNLKVVDQTIAAQQQITRVLFSASTNGRPIAVAATATPGTLIHSADGTDIDEIWLWVNNRTGTAATLTLEWGGVGTSDQITQALSIPANSSPILIIQGEILTGSLNLRAFSGTANALNISGYVNRISTP